MPVSREIRLAARPQGAPQESDFELAEAEVAEPADGEVLVRNSYLSVDPYMRSRMNDMKSYIPSFQVGEPMQGGAVGQVIASRNERFQEGDWVQGLLGWRELYTSDGNGLFPVDPSLAPVSTALGVLGMPGLTAYAGLFDIGKPEEGETVYVSAAAGAVGSTVGQMARIKGCRAVGSAGSDEKVAWLLDELGFDAAFNYRERNLDEALRETCPNGIDIYFDNVGGDHLNAALAQMNLFGRVPLCGMVSQYNAQQLPPGPPNIVQVLINRLTIRGFIVMDHFGLLHEFLEEAGEWVRSGQLKYRETIVEGIENMPAAFIGLLEGENIGKMLVKVGPDPTPA